MSGDMVGTFRLGFGEVLWSHTSHCQHQQERLCLIHLLLPTHPMQDLQSFRGFLAIPTLSKWPGWVPHTGNGEHSWVGFHLSTDPDVVLCRACQAFLACWDAR